MTAHRLQTEIPAPRGGPVSERQAGPHVTYQPHRLSNTRASRAVTSTRPAPEPAPAHHTDDHPVHCTLFAVDIVSFTDRRRDDEIQRYIRKAMYRAIRNSFDRAGVGWHEWFRQDRGDGVLVVVPSAVSAMLFLDPLIDLLRAELRFHNKMSSEPAQIRLRVALHAGSVFFDGNGVVGHALTRLFTLLDAPAFKAEFRDTAAEIGLVTSEHLYDDVIRHTSGLVDPADYRPIEVAEDEFVTRGYVHIPPGPAGRAPSLLHQRRSASATAHTATAHTVAAHAAGNGAGCGAAEVTAVRDVRDVRDVREARGRDARDGRESWEAPEVRRAAR
ncbi:hypothetical protein [Actinomadura sp. HBU206391]|uniref:hypothetical protein n=1 Tax=Actinomadura sp. HBU206391 TaxID=2731692 RepID=UPI0016504A1F|nr:hypothetical protein [Actinomadura sp. HBU206391]MBC6456716.1 hypothetical protein [Actinomadura sp. HBU206391]